MEVWNVLTLISLVLFVLTLILLFGLAHQVGLLSISITGHTSSDLTEHFISGLPTMSDVPNFAAQTMSGQPVSPLEQAKGHRSLFVLLSNTCTKCQTVARDLTVIAQEVRLNGIDHIAVISKGDAAGVNNELWNLFDPAGIHFAIQKESEAQVAFNSIIVPWAVVLSEHGLIEEQGEVMASDDVLKLIRGPKVIEAMSKT